MSALTSLRAGSCGHKGAGAIAHGASAHRTELAALVGALMLAGCARAVPPPQMPPPPAPAPQITRTADDWNIFPDPLTGRVEIYHKGEYVGSVTGDEKEDPPMPRKRPDDHP